MQRGFSYSPSTVINPAVFASHLFLRPRYEHYYFGDYYAPSYANAGFSPSFTFQSSRFGYDPFFAQERWQHRQDPNWQQRTEANFRDFTNNPNIRPPRTLAAQMALAANAAAQTMRKRSWLPRRSTNSPRAQTIRCGCRPWTKRSNNNSASIGKSTVSS